MYELNSELVPLSINFNPLLISFSLLMRVLGDLTKPCSAQQKQHIDEASIVRSALTSRKKLIQNMYTSHTQAVKHALKHIVGHPALTQHDKLPQLVIDFIKKWVAKEKVLINQIVANLVNEELTEEHENARHQE